VLAHRWERHDKHQGESVALSLKELADQIGAELVGDGDLIVSSANTLEDAGPGQVGFLANPKYAQQIESTRASAVIVSPAVKNERIALLKTKDPYFAFANAVIKLHGYRSHPHKGIHPQAHVEPTAAVGEGCVLYPGVYVGPRARIGRDCVLFPNVVIYDDCVLGDRVTIHANTSIGQDGFGYAPHKGEHQKIPQVGNVVIEDDVEIAANCAISRGALGSTIIGKGTKIDSLVTIGHGAQIGPHGLLVAQVGIAGSVKIGHHVTMAGQVGVAGHLKIGNNVTVGAQSGIMEDLPDQGTFIGAPAMPALHARRVYAVFTQLPDLLQRIKQLEQKVEELSIDGANGAQ
jgi:UDP-3-O-[3-hydroxymyristoyl] glucosamine N-acyltransferase